MKIEPLGDSTDPLINNFNISVEEINKIIQDYCTRSLAEEILAIEEEGGIVSLAERLKTSLKNGLSNRGDQSVRTRIFGDNKAIKPIRRTYFEICWDVLKDPILRILVISGLISLIIGATLDDNPEYGWIEGFAIMVAVAVVVNVTAINDFRTDKKFTELRKKNRSGRLITLLRDGIWTSVNPKKLLVGDIIRIENGVTIPADGLLIEGSNIEIVEAAMTGENDNIKKLPLLDAIKYKDEYFKNYPEIVENIHGDNDRHHDIPSPIILSGTNLAEGIGTMLVLAVGKNSAEGILTNLTNTNDELTSLQQKLIIVATAIGKLGFICAIITVLALYLRLIINIIITKHWDTSVDIVNFIKYLIIGVTVLVVAIPEGLPLAVTISLSYSVKKMQEDKNLVRKMQACETMGGADQICSDKTGTLTQNKMTASHLWVDNNVLNLENDQKSKINFEAEFLHYLKESIFTNSSAFIDPLKGNQGSKTEIALILFMNDLGHSDLIETRNVYYSRLFRNFPFSSKRKRSSIVITTEDKKLRLHVKGASEVVSGYCKNYLTISGKSKIIDSVILNSIYATIREMTQNALRVIAIAYKDLDNNADIEKLDTNGFPELEKSELTLIALIGIRDPIRTEVPNAVQACQKAGITVRMVTGDNKTTATAIAKECKIINKDSDIVMEGKEFAAITGGTVCSSCKTKSCFCPRNSKEAGKTKIPIREDVVANLDAFKELVPNLVVLARSQPDDKYTLVTGLKQLGHVVAVTGDGTNDAPALKKADIGFAMGITGTEMAKEAAGIILLDDNFKSIVKAVIWGRNIYDNIRSFIQFQMTVNIVAVICAMIGAITIQQPALTSVQLLWVNLIMDSLASLALATDPPTDEHLNRLPYNKKASIIEKRMWKHIIMQSILQIIILLTIVFAGEWFLPEFGKEGGSVLYNEDTNYVISGRLYHFDGSNDYSDKQNNPNIGPSRQFTYIFNIFVLLQLTNEINSRKLRDEINVFQGILRNKMFIGIWFFTFFMQVIIIELGSYPFSCHLQGLTVQQWFICVAVSLISLVWRIILVMIPNWIFPTIEDNKRVRKGTRVLSLRGDAVERNKRSLIFS